MASEQAKGPVTMNSFMVQRGILRASLRCHYQVFRAILKVFHDFRPRPELNTDDSNDLIGMQFCDRTRFDVQLKRIEEAKVKGENHEDCVLSERRC